MPSIARWNRPTLQIEETDSGTGTCIALHWSRDIPGGEFAHQLRFYPVQTTVDPLEWCLAVARVVCHVLVDEIPERGLSELYESLSSMHQFYLEQPERRPAALPSVRQIDATVGRTMERPRFQLESDE